MAKDLEQLYRIQLALKSSGYPDYQRISNEILDFSSKSSTPLDEILTQIENNTPWEYIKGSAEFMGKQFKVTKDTLIPRLESEDFIKHSTKILNDCTEPFNTVIDVGTGSGCLIINISHKNRIATDISTKALAVAKENAKNILGKHNIEFIHTNLIENITLQKIDEPILIMANLPYIPTKQLETLDDSVIKKEPTLALDGGESGLKYYEELFDQIIDKGLNNTTLLIEIEPTTLEECKELISNRFPKSTVKVLTDFRNQDRFVLIRLP